MLSRVSFWFALNLLAVSLLLVVHFGTAIEAKVAEWQLIFNLGMSALIGSGVAFPFYFLVVYLPDRRKRSVIKSNFKKLYRRIKEDILYEIVVASQKGGRDDLSTDREAIDRLMIIENFRQAFEGGWEGNEGFYAFRNYMSDDVPEYRTILLNLQFLAKQIDYVLHNYTIEDQAIFDFFKRLEMYIIRIEKNGPGYEEEKMLSRFIWEIFAGWDWIKGYTGVDFIENMIDEM